MMRVTLEMIAPFPKYRTKNKKDALTVMQVIARDPAYVNFLERSGEISLVPEAKTFLGRHLERINSEAAAKAEAVVEESVEPEADVDDVDADDAGTEVEGPKDEEPKADIKSGKGSKKK